MRLRFATAAVAFCLAMLAAIAQAAPVVTLTSTVSRGLSPLPVPVTWTSTDAVSCTASGLWSGAKALSGTQTIVVTASGRVTLTCQDSAGTTGSAVLNYGAPTLNTDGSALTDLAGFKAYWGTSATVLSQASPDIPAGTLTYTINGLAPGT